MFRYTKVALLVFVAFGSFAQTLSAPKPLSVPLIEDRDLYAAFFQYHQSLVNTLQAAQSANPPASTQLNQQMASLLGVDLADLPTLIKTTTWFTQQNASVAADQAKPPSSSTTSGPTAAQLSASFDFTRVRITVETVRIVFQNVSAASWTGLHAYITGTFKNTIYKH